MEAGKRSKFIAEIAALLQIALFVYAAVNKLLDLENFRVQIGQSPMFSAFAGVLAFAVPISELMIALLLALRKTRLAGMYAAFSLMVMFTAYIFIILNYGAHVPCSCGGVLELLGWEEHLLFNLFFVFLTGIGIVLELQLNKCRAALQPKKIALRIGSLFTISALSVFVLYLLSEDIIHHRNNFVRRFTQGTSTEKHIYELKTPAYYFAGINGNTIYLGNTLAPRVVIAIDKNLKDAREIVISMDRMDLPFVSVQVRVQPPFFYLTDGTVPCIFKGRIGEWKASLMPTPSAFFTRAEPIDSSHFAVRAIDGSVMRSSLGLLTLHDNRISWKRSLLISDGDGIFDVDGLLLSNGSRQLFHYLHFYRNEYFTMDSNLELLGRNHTIDTISKTRLSVAYLKKRKERKLSAPPKIVNGTASAYGNLLFVNSRIIGKYEDEQMWRHASVIDVYDLDEGSYIYSFYLYHTDKKKAMRSFIVSGDVLYALSGAYLTAVPLPDEIKERLKM